ncbi:MAG: superinfection immunity protein [Devosia sp.]|jgi:asparagine N-glycosylation enzyme membrane subunit Stt3|nr:superinfection immunity protein [Devosia sp.]
MNTSSAPEALFYTVLIVIYAIVALIYFLPTLVAWKRKSPNLSTILLVNLLAGWTVIGWLLPLWWAFKREKFKAHTSDTSDGTAWDRDFGSDTSGEPAD